MRIDFKPQLLESVEEFLSELDNSYFYVMNYNINTLGKLEDMRVIAKEINISI